MSLPTGGPVARSRNLGATSIKRSVALSALAFAWTMQPAPAAAQVYFGASDSGFSAFDDTGAPLANPDIAVGPNLIVAVDSGEVAWYSKNNQMLGALPLSGPGGLWDWIDDPADLTDAQVIWNNNAQRYYVASVGVLADGMTHLNIAISNTADPADGWAVRHDPSGAINRLSIGIYGDGLYAVYDYATGEGCWYFRATRDELLDPDRHHFVGGQLSESPRAFACNVSSGSGDGRMIISSAEESTINRLRIVGKNEAWSGGPRITSWINIPWQSQPPMIPQLGGSPIDSGGMNFRSAKVVNDSCWLAQTVAKGDHAIVRWYEIDLNGWPVSGGAPALKQTGDIDLGAGVHTFLPDIAVDAQGNAAIVFSISSASQRVSVARAVRFHDDPLGTFRQHRIFLNSADAIVSDEWGAYVGIEADPVLPGVFWSHTPYHEGSWKTWIGKVTLADDDLPSDGPRLDTPDNGFIHNIIPVFRWDFNDLTSGYRVSISTRPDFSGNDTYVSQLIDANTFEIPDGLLECNTRYYWRVVAETDHGDMMSDPESRWFEKRLLQDINQDGLVDSADLGMFIRAFNTSTPAADFNSDGIVNSSDLGQLISAFGQTCD